MRKFFVSLILGAMAIAPLQALAEYRQTDAGSYLSAHATNPWSAMALSTLGALDQAPEFLRSTSGSSAIEYAAPILAITAFGQDPRTFGADNLVEKLESYHDNGQLGDPATVNDDVFGLLALVAAGESAEAAPVADAKTFITSHQQDNGGWGFAVSGGPDSNMTAAAIVALIAAGEPASAPSVQKGLAYLKTAQNDDGGFAYNPASEWGTASDTASTAWAVWALTSAGIDPASWTKAEHSPLDYLKGQQTPEGYFRYQTGSGEDAFSPVTTAYAVIALAGRTLPLKKISAIRKFDFRIEGKDKTVCQGAALGPTALDVVKNAGSLCGFSYHIAETSFGPYLDQIGEDRAEGLIGWLYLVNYSSPDVGAADYVLQAGDSVLWYYGDFGRIPTRLTLSDKATEKNGDAEVLVEAFSQGAWSPLSGAKVHYGPGSATTGTDGKTTVSPSEGLYLVYAEKTGYVRTNSESLRVGSPSGNQISLSVKIVEGQTQGATLAFVVTPDSLDFGELAAGENRSKSFTLKNTGNVNLAVESVVSGDQVFLDNLRLGASDWRNYQKNLAAGQTESVDAELSIPADSSASLGEKTAQLTFWAVND